MAMVFCVACGKQISDLAPTCPGCGHPNEKYVADLGAARTLGSTYGGEIKSRTTAGILGILLGAFGVHKFYLGRIGEGILMLVFCWTAIPGIIGMIEGIIYLTQSDAEFSKKNGVRTA